jgi:hypothetical protein
MKYDSDPNHSWVRKNFDESLLYELRKEKKFREIAEIEANRDLIKPIEQLVTDVHEEIHNPTRLPVENTASAQKRMVSMMARVAMSNDRLTKQVIRLTWAIAFMTFLVTVFTILLWSKG